MVNPGVFARDKYREGDIVLYIFHGIIILPITLMSKWFAQLVLMDVEIDWQQLNLSKQ